ncbi:MAG: response regulator transcription factor [Bacteriovoracaceae bacterium]|nr:response regulator transcription factor [Bacteriovoracaceae bacterium]
MHLTIVDDMQDNLECYQELLGDRFELELIQDPTGLIPFLSKTSTDMLILDLHMPKIEGFELFEEVRKDHKNLPVIFLTADPSEDAVVKGLSLGAEDFITKPVSLRELEARILNKLIKSPELSGEESSEKCLKFDGFILYLKTQSAKVEDKLIQLTPIEFKLISLLASNPNEVYDRSYISNMLWPNVHVQNQNIDTHLSNLRKKLHPFSKNIKTIKSRGYILRI